MRAGDHLGSNRSDPLRLARYGERLTTSNNILG